MRTLVRGFENVGYKQTTSEDFFLIDEEISLFVVCDGSKSKDGRWAAETLSETIRSEIRKDLSKIRAYRDEASPRNKAEVQRQLGQAVQEAAKKIFSESHIEKLRTPTASSLIAGICVADHLVWTHVGSTRLYLARDGQLHCLSKDHTYYEEMLESLPKGAAVNPIFKKRLTRSIGDTESVPLVIHCNQVATGDVFLFCSNGVSDAFESGRVGHSLLTQAQDLTSVSEALVENSWRQNVEDNLCGIVLKFVEGAANERPLRRIPIDVQKQIEILRSLSFLKSLQQDEKALIRLQGLLGHKNVPKGGTIIQEGSGSEELYIILDGEADVLMNGKRVSRLGANDIIGEMGFFTLEKRIATVVASESCRLVSIHRKEFEALVQIEPRLGMKILEGVVRQLSDKLKRHSNVI